MSLSRWIRWMRGVSATEEVEDGPSEILPADPRVLPTPSQRWGPTEDAGDRIEVPIGEDREALAVYADAMLSEGDIRGEHVALMLRGEDRLAASLRSNYRSHFYGPAAGWKIKALFQLADVGTNRDAPVQVHWRNGFLDTLWIQVSEARIEPLLAFLGHPSCARLRILVLVGPRMHGLGERIVEHGPFPSIQRLHIGDATTMEVFDHGAHQGDWPALDTTFPNLLHLAANGAAELGPLPRLQTVQICREEAFARVDWGPPGRLRALRMARLCGAHAEVMLARDDLDSLRDLRVGREVGKTFVATLEARPRLLEQLEVLGFQRCDMRHTERRLLAVVPRMPRLEELYLPEGDTAYYRNLSRAFPDQVALAPREMRHAHFWREVGEPELGVIGLDDAP